MMRKAPSAADPESYVAGLAGWQRACVTRLREAVRRAGALEETVKWGHLVYFANGPVVLIRAEESRVLFGFWRGKRLVEIEPRLKPSGKYEMATIQIVEGPAISPAKATRLIRAAVALNRTLGDPTKATPQAEGQAPPVRKDTRDVGIPVFAVAYGFLPSPKKSSEKMSLPGSPARRSDTVPALPASQGDRHARDGVREGDRDQ